MDFPLHIDTISMALPGVTDRIFLIAVYVFLSLKVVLNLADSADPDEMQHSHLDLHCLPK